MEFKNKKESIETQSFSSQNEQNINKNSIICLPIASNDGTQYNLNNRNFIYTFYLNDIDTLNESEQVDENPIRDNSNLESVEKNKSTKEININNSFSFKDIMETQKKIYTTSLKKINKLHQNFEILYNESVQENKKFEEDLKKKYLEFQKQLEENSKKNEKLYLDEISSLKNKLQEKDITINSLEQSNYKLKEKLKKIETELLNTRNLLIQYNQIIKNKDLLLFKLKTINYNNENDSISKNYYSQLGTESNVAKITNLRNDFLIRLKNNKADNLYRLLKDNSCITNTNNSQSPHHYTNTQTLSRSKNVNSAVNIKNESISFPRTNNPTIAKILCCSPFSYKKQKNHKVLSPKVNDLKGNYADINYENYFMEENSKNKIPNEISNAQIDKFGYKDRKLSEKINKKNNFLSKKKDKNKKNVLNKNMFIHPIKKEKEKKNNVYEENTNKNLLMNENGMCLNNIINFTAHTTDSPNSKLKNKNKNENYFYTNKCANILTSKNEPKNSVFHVKSKSNFDEYLK